MCKDNELNIKEVTGIIIVMLNNSDVSSVVEIDKTSETLVDYIKSKQPSKMVVNFDDIKFVASKTLGMLLKAWKIIDAYGGTIIISGINPQLSRLFRITNLDKIFKYYPDIDSAVAAIQ